jgi:cephalosporin hydroxylase
VNLNLRDRLAIVSFHELYYNIGLRHQGTFVQTRWMGVQTEKLPLDLWIYQELLFELKPQLVIETGTRHGGSALFIAHMLDIIGGENGGGKIVSIDIAPDEILPQHPRITFLRSSSTAPEMVGSVTSMAAGKSPVLVILDSDHTAAHVLAEMRAYHSLVTPGSYMIVEDTNVNGHPVFPEFGPGPLEAVQSFLKENQEFEIDQSREKFLITFNPHGYLRKIQR